MIILSACIFKDDNVLFYHGQSSINKLENGRIIKIVDVNWKNEEGFVFTTSKNIAFFDIKQEDFYLYILNPNNNEIKDYLISKDEIIKELKTSKFIYPSCLFVDDINNIVAFVNNNSTVNRKNYSIIALNYNTNEIIFEKEIASRFDYAVVSLDFENQKIFYSKDSKRANVSIFYSELSDINKEYPVLLDIYQPSFSLDSTKIAFFKNGKVHIFDIENNINYDLEDIDFSSSIIVTMSFSSDDNKLIINSEERRLSFIFPANKIKLYEWNYLKNRLKKIYRTNDDTTKKFLSLEY